jgi:hypothetical protein
MTRRSAFEKSTPVLGCIGHPTYYILPTPCLLNDRVLRRKWQRYKVVAKQCDQRRSLRAGLMSRLKAQSVPILCPMGTHQPRMFSEIRYRIDHHMQYLKVVQALIFHASAARQRANSTSCLVSPLAFKVEIRSRGAAPQSSRTAIAVLVRTRVDRDRDGRFR